MAAAAELTSMGPRRCRRGRPQTQWESSSASAHFNGATPMSAWKTSSAGESSSCGLATSMGPRRCRRGRQRPEVFALRLSRNFNGATPMSAWKTGPARGPQRADTPTSMGPRRCRRGRRPPPRRLQNSSLHPVPREPIATGASTSIGDFGRLTEVRRSQAFPIRERGALSFFLITTELPKGLGRESHRSPFPRQYHSRRVFAQKKATRRLGSRQ
jgi:hypothetical protein